ncbi:MAG: hypothetical protein A4E57_02254 [Syntrophorhabdaceae bacterium PtaU1.Bin034]|nr:MAG: hypothetical protein A4E57_02254 [Syntrophorhabdaceae bacterium PtaU1.Bin034]
MMTIKHGAKNARPPFKYIKAKGPDKMPGLLL